MYSTDERNSTKAYYETHAGEYFTATHDADLEPLWEKLGQRLNQNALVLDLGCGPGRDLLRFSRQGFRTVGIDYSYNLLKLARGFAKQPVVQGDFASLPFKPRIFDAVWAISSLLHVPRQVVPSILMEIHTLLKDNSILVTSLKKGHGDTVDFYGRYTVFYTLKEWEDILEASGYVILESKENVEIREAALIGTKEITWLTCVAQKI